MLKYYCTECKTFYDTEPEANECIASHEAARAEAEKREAEREARLKEVEDARAHYLELRKAFIADYPSESPKVHKVAASPVINVSPYSPLGAMLRHLTD